MSKSKIKKSNLIFGLVLVIGISMLLIRAFICTSWNIADEVFNISTSYRFFLGDAPFCDEWNPAQLHGLVILPLISLFKLFNETNDGIILFMRLSYIASKCVLLLWCYIKLDKAGYNNFISKVALLLWMFFAPFNFGTLSYQATPILLLLPILIILYFGGNIIEMVIVGAFYALSILSQPFFVLSYIILITVFIYSVIDKKIQLNKVIAFHAGIIIVFIYFVFIVASRASYDELITNIPYFFNVEGHDYSSNNFFIKSFLKSGRVILEFIVSDILVTVMNLTFIIFLIINVIKGKSIEKYRCYAYLVMLISAIYILFLDKAYYMNEINVIFMWFSVEMIIYNRNRKFLMYMIFAGMYVFAVASSTDTGMFGTSAGLIVPGLLSLIMGYHKDSNIDNHKSALREMINYISLGTIVAMFGILATFEFYEHLIDVREYSISMTKGPAKGLYTNEEENNKYSQIIDDLDSIKYMDDDVFLCVSLYPVAYLHVDKKYGCAELYTYRRNYTRLNKYYEIHADRFPTVVYYCDFDSENDSSFCNELKDKGYNIVANGNRLIAIKDNR